MMQPQTQYVIGLYRDVNPTKNRCRHNIGCPLGFAVLFLTIIYYFAFFSAESLSCNQLPHETYIDYITTQTGSRTIV